MHVRVGDDEREFASGLTGDNDFERAGDNVDFGDAQGLEPLLPLRDSILFKVAAVNFGVGD